MIEIATSATATTVSASGDLDLAVRDRFPEITARVGALRRRLLIIDMCGVELMDSTGAAFLISLAESSARRGGTTILRGADERVLFVLDVCGALDRFRVEPDHRCAAAHGAPRSA